MNLLFLANSYNSPSARFRIWQFVEPLRDLGHNVTVRVTFPARDWEPAVRNPVLKSGANRLASVQRLVNALWITRDIEQFDVIFMNRDLLPSMKIIGLEPWLCRRNPHFIFDFDDAIFTGSREKKLRHILPHFACLTPGNSYLADFARQLNPNVEIWPTVVDTDRYVPVTNRVSGPIRVGWSGSKSTLQYCLPMLTNVFRTLTAKENIEIIIIAEVHPVIPPDDFPFRYIQWTPESEVEGLQQIDIGLMPLRDEAFERGKCGLKAIQYMGVGIPALVSPVGVNREIVPDGETGYHCQTDQDWIDRLELLIHQPELRSRLGIAARERIISRYSVKSLLPHMVKRFEAVASG